MATVSRHVDASPEQVWEVLCDGWRYSNWVVGTSHMRSVDQHWPEPGSRLEHATGIWPAVVRDSTEVTRSQRPSVLSLVAHGGALGDARIDMRVEPSGPGSEVTMSEELVAGLGRLLRNPLTDAVVRRRNTEALGRLAALAEARTPPARH